MNRPILLIFLMISFSCKNEKVKYYNNEKWTWVSPDMYWWNYETIKKSPVEVKETFYDSLNNPRDYNSGKFQYYILRKFDKEGNILFQKQVYPDSSWSVSDIRIDANGLQEKYYFSADTKFLVDSKDTGRVISVLLGNGIFEIKEFNISGIQPNPSVNRISFFDEGGIEKNEELFNKIIERKNSDGKTSTMLGFSDRMETHSFTNKYFDSHHRILKYVYKPKKSEGYSFYYYYSTSDFPDSIFFNDGKIKKTVYLFVINTNGDPITEMCRHDHSKLDTVSNYDYLYDNKHNWIRRSKKWANGSTLIIREITY